MSAERAGLASRPAHHQSILDDEHLDDNEQAHCRELPSRNEAEELTERIRETIAKLPDNVVQVLLACALALDGVTALCPCGGEVNASRSDAAYCSSACRQRAYRHRKAVSS